MKKALITSITVVGIILVVSNQSRILSFIRLSKNSKSANIYNWFYNNREIIEESISKYLSIEKDKYIVTLDDHEKVNVLGEFCGRDNFGRVFLYINNIERIYKYNILAKIFCILTLVHEMTHLKQFLYDNDFFTLHAYDDNYYKIYNESPIEVQARSESYKYVMSNLSLILDLVRK